MNCSPPGSSVHGILQARILEWVAISSSRGSSRPRDRTHVSHIAGRFFTVWGTREILFMYTPEGNNGKSLNSNILGGRITRVCWHFYIDFYSFFACLNTSYFLKSQKIQKLRNPWIPSCICLLKMYAFETFLRGKKNVPKACGIRGFKKSKVIPLTLTPRNTPRAGDFTGGRWRKSWEGILILGSEGKEPPAPPPCRALGRWQQPR